MRRPNLSRQIIASYVVFAFTMNAAAPFALASPVSPVASAPVFQHQAFSLASGIFSRPWIKHGPSIRLFGWLGKLIKPTTRKVAILALLVTLAVDIVQDYRHHTAFTKHVYEENLFKLNETLNRIRFSQKFEDTDDATRLYAQFLEAVRHDAHFKPADVLKWQLSGKEENELFEKYGIFVADVSENRDSKKERMAALDVLLNAIPAPLRRCITAMVFGDHIALQKYEFVSPRNGQTVLVTAYPKKKISMTHEMGHAVDLSSRSPMPPDERARFRTYANLVFNKMALADIYADPEEPQLYIAKSKDPGQLFAELFGGWLDADYLKLLKFAKRNDNSKETVLMMSRLFVKDGRLRVYLKAKDPTKQRPYIDVPVFGDASKMTLENMQLAITVAFLLKDVSMWENVDPNWARELMESGFLMLPAQPAKRGSTSPQNRFLNQGA